MSTQVRRFLGEGVIVSRGRAVGAWREGAPFWGRGLAPWRCGLGVKTPPEGGQVLRACAFAIQLPQALHSQPRQHSRWA